VANRSYPRIYDKWWLAVPYALIKKGILLYVVILPAIKLSIAASETAIRTLEKNHEQHERRVLLRSAEIVRVVHLKRKVGLWFYYSWYHSGTRAFTGD
jgi:hypothetical protein